MITSSEVSIHFTESEFYNDHTLSSPFYFLGHLVAVQANLDDETGYFILDSGSQRMILNSNHFTDTYRSNRSSISSTNALKITHSKRVTDLNINGFQLPKVRADVVDLTHLEQNKNARILGVLGYDVFKDFEVFIDYQFRRLILTELDKKGNRKDPLSIPDVPIDSLNLIMHRYAMNIEGTIGTTKLKFNLDTGAEINLIDRSVPAEVLENFEIIRRVTMIGIGDQKIEALAGRLTNLRCGPRHYRSLSTLLTNLDYIKKSTGRSVEGVLGYPFFYLKRFSFNIKKKKLYFYKTEPSGP